MMGKQRPVCASAFRLNSANRASSPATSPATTMCFDIFSPPPGDSEVINHFERLRCYGASGEGVAPFGAVQTTDGAPHVAMF